MSAAHPHQLDRLLIVGLGSIGRRHARLARQLMPSVEIAGLRRHDSGERAEIGIDDCVTTLEDAVRWKPQAAVIASPASQHLASAVALAAAGVDLLIEKPVAHASAGVAELVVLAEQRGVVAMTGYNLRFAPSLARFREVVASDRIGRILSIRAEAGQYLPAWRPNVDYRESVSAQAKLGGGALLELSHEIDYLRWIFGDITWVEASLAKQSALEIDVEDVAHLIVGFGRADDGTSCVGTLTVDFIRHDRTRYCEAIGERGSLRWDGIRNTIEVFDQNAAAWQTLWSEPALPDESYLAEWRHFLGCVADRTPPAITGWDGLAVLRIVEAARASAASEARVRVEPMATPVHAGIA
jgi:predicted dehydrogenase